MDLSVSPDGAWQKIIDTPLGVAVSQVDFTDLGFDNYRRLRFTVSEGQFSAGGYVFLRFNDEATTYRVLSYFVTEALNHFINQYTGTTITTMFHLGKVVTDNINTFNYACELEITNRAGYSRSVRGSYVHGDNAAGCIQYNGFLNGVSGNTTSPLINKISFIVNTGTIKVGTKFTIWGMK